MVLPTRGGGNPGAVIVPDVTPAPWQFAQIHIFKELGFVADSVGLRESLQLKAAPVGIRNNPFSGTVFIAQFQGQHESGAVVGTVPHPVNQSLVIDMRSQTIRAGTQAFGHVKPVVGMGEMVGRRGSLYDILAVNIELIIIIARDEHCCGSRGAVKGDFLPEQGVHVGRPGSIRLGLEFTMEEIQHRHALKYRVANPRGIGKYLRFGSHADRRKEKDTQGKHVTHDKTPFL